MKKPVRTLMRVAKLALLRKYVSREEIADDYNRISSDYDFNFSSRAAAHSDELVERVAGLPPKARILDLACGTGAVVAAWRRRFPDADITGVDSSPGMLAVARERCPEAHFVEGDMESSLRDVPDESLDAVSCAWAIGYARPPLLARTVLRKLKPGGVFAVVENRRDTWPQIRRAAFGVAMEMPESLMRLMDLHLRLPKSGRSLGRIMRSAGFADVEFGGGSEEFTFADGRAVLDWSLGTGVSAGFDRAMDPARRDECDAAFVRLVERGMTSEGVKVEHRYVWAKGVKA
ncbi:MAG: methyltransferase domain-containing protein [Kiritimatiellae bacterium]|nr:methyltransferase domain-containing protein [Kiritimatiellia bacterium]